MCIFSLSYRMNTLTEASFLREAERTASLVSPYAEHCHLVEIFRNNLLLFITTGASEAAATPSEKRRN